MATKPNTRDTTASPPRQSSGKLHCMAPAEWSLPPLLFDRSSQKVTHPPLPFPCLTPLAGSDGEHLRNELLLRKTLPLRSQSRQLLKQARFLPLPHCPLTALCRQKRYSELMMVLSPLSSSCYGGRVKFTASPAWIYLQSLIFIQVTLSPSPTHPPAPPP